MGRPKVVNADALEALSAVEDPGERHAAFLQAMNDARELQAELARRRGLTVYELYHQHGAGKAARLLGISRASLYRIIAEHAPPEVKKARKDAAIMTATLVAQALAEAQKAAAASATANDPQALPGATAPGPENLRGGTS